MLLWCCGSAVAVMVVGARVRVPLTLFLSLFVTGPLHVPRSRLCDPCPCDALSTRHPGPRLLPRGESSPAGAAADAGRRSNGHAPCAPPATATAASAGELGAHPVPQQPRHRLSLLLAESRLQGRGRTPTIGQLPAAAKEALQVREREKERELLSSLRRLVSILDSLTQRGWEGFLPPPGSFCVYASGGACNQRDCKEGYALLKHSHRAAQS